MANKKAYECVGCAPWGRSTRSSLRYLDSGFKKFSLLLGIKHVIVKKHTK